MPGLLMRERKTKKLRRHQSQPANDMSDPENVPLFFQVSVNVLEARKLPWSNPQTACSYVVAILGHKKHRTTVRKNQEEPVYREYLIFDIYMSTKEVQRSSLWLGVLEPKCCAATHLLGEATIDLGAVWALPNHQVYHKWVQLSLPPESTTSRSSFGFLKIDISITLRGEVQVMPAIVTHDKVEDHLHISMGSEQQRAKYQVTVYSGFNFPNPVQNYSDRRYRKGPTTYVRVSFCGIVGKTSVQQNSSDPIYNDQISLVEMFPNMNQLIKFEVCTAETTIHRVLSSVELNLEQVSHDGDNGFLPTFGPSLLHMYATTNTIAAAGGGGSDVGPFYKGSLLVSLKTMVPYYQHPVRTVSVAPIPPLLPEDFWSVEEFCIYCSIFEISMLDQLLVQNVSGVAMTIAEIPSEKEGEDEFELMASEIRNRKLHYTGSLEIIKSESNYGSIEFRERFQVLQLAVQLPDFRFRMYRNNIVLGIVANLERSVEDVEKRLLYFDYSNPSELINDLNKAIDDAAGSILKYLDIVNYSSNSIGSEDALQNYSTELDHKQLLFQKGEIEKIYNQITQRGRVDSIANIFYAVDKCGTKDYLAGTRKAVKYLLADTKELAIKLKNIICKTPCGLPDLIIWLLNEGSRVAYKKVHLSEIIYSVIPEQCGLHCGQLQTFFMNPIKCQKHAHRPAATCHCIGGKIEVLLWVGLFRQRHAFSRFLPNGYNLKVTDMDMSVKGALIMLECKAFIYRAKLVATDESMKTYNPFVRVNVIGGSKDSQVKIKTLQPIWNQVLRVNKLVHSSSERLHESPPYALIEVYSEEYTEYPELLGRFKIQPTIEDRPGYAPKLRWYELFKGSQNTGQLLMSIQLSQLPETIIRCTQYVPVEKDFCNANANLSANSMENTNAIEPLPASLIPYNVTYKADIYWWGLRDVNITKRPMVVLEIDELVIKSEVISEKKHNCNFSNGRMSQIFESPLIDEYSPTVCIGLYDSSTFGRTFFLGTNVIKHPSKFLLEWLPKHDRDLGLKTASIRSTDFCEVEGKMLFAKKTNSSELFDDMSSIEADHTMIKSSSWLKKVHVNKKKWLLFGRREPKDEEITLLPLYTKENNKIKTVRKLPKRKESTDWWSRFNKSEKQRFLDDIGPDHITIYDYELEHQPQFFKFKDWCSTLKLYNGKKTGIPDKDQQLQCGLLKAGIVIYQWPPPQNVIAVNYNGVELDKGYFHEFPENSPSKFIVRVYIVKGINLHRATSGQSDPYVIMNCGRRQLGDRKSHVPNTTNPIFGKMYEFGCNLPEDYSLKISVYDHDPTPPDELIGSTTIDLEDRIYSKHRARVGLAPEYKLAGPCKWRDNQKPSAILEELCSVNHISAPKFPSNNSVIINNFEYKDISTEHISNKDIESKENICLSILHKWQTLPMCGYHLVPEHVETRSLVHPDNPGIERGKIQMWVDIFPLDGCSYLPPPRDITPPKVEEYELRVIIWDVHTMFHDHDSKRSWKTADLFVNVWIGSVDFAQQTDIHHNSLSGEGNFNWRMVFNFLYHHAERKILNKEKGPFTEYEEYVQPILVVEVIDSSSDKKLGVLSLNLNGMPRGVKSAQQCGTETQKACGKYVDLFSTHSIRAWWPLKNEVIVGEGDYAGAIDMELTLLPQEKAVLMPAGVGRNPPSRLPEPTRFQNQQSQSTKMDTVKSTNGKDVITYFLIIAGVWCIAYIIYLAFPSAESFISEEFRRVDKNGHYAHGIIRSFYELFQ